MTPGPTRERLLPAGGADGRLPRLRRGRLVATLAAVVAAGAVAGALVWSGAGGGVSTHGPLGDSDGPGQAQNCVPYDGAGRPVTITVGDFTVPPGPRVTVESVTLAHQSGLALSGAMIDLHGDMGVGYWSQFPPTAARLRAAGISAADWATRRPAVGAVVTATPVGKSYDLFLGIRTRSSAAGAYGHFRYAVVDYRDSHGHKYRWLTPSGGSTGRRC